MKAIDNHTGEIVEIDDCSPVTYRTPDGTMGKSLIKRYTFLDAKIDYYEKLKHQYAGMAMQGILSNPEVDLDYKSDECMPQAVAATAYNIAHALVEKIKEIK